jgi:glycosyltransferase involved in cell wall biosynthesis
MNVLMITGIFPPDIGGPASYVPAIASSLVQRGHKITVITLSDATTHIDGEYPFTVIRIGRSILRPIRVLKTVSSIIRQGKHADLLFVHGLALEAVAANLLLHKPLVQKIVGDLAWERTCSQGIIQDDIEAFQRIRYGLKIELTKKLRSFWVRKSDSIITPSGYLKKIVCCWGVPEEKITVIYNAVDAAQLAPNTSKTAHARSSHDPVHKTIVSAGRLVPWKGFASLIRVMEQLPEAHLQIIGEGPERVNLEALIREKNLQGRVQLPGNVSRRELFAALEHADLFVLNST